MDAASGLILFGAGLLAGAMNAAGGGSFVTIPALVSVGLPSVAANASSTVVFLLRQLGEASGLLRRGKGFLRTTPAGRRMLDTADQGALQALMFHVAFWHLDLAPLGRGLLQDWPQRDAGVVLWCLSVAAADWQPRERLTRMCAIPVNGVLDHPWDVGSWAMDARILRPLWWFGLLEHRDEEVEGGRLEKRHLYRKSPLFDRFLSFDVVLEAAGGVRH